MATLLMVESWVRSTGQALPGIIAGLGHRYLLLTRDHALYPPGDGTAHPVVAGAEEIIRADTNDLAAVAATARALARRRQIDGVLTTCDYYLEAAATAAAALGLPGAAAGAMATATRKHLVRRSLHAGGVHGPRFAACAGWEEARRAASELGYPLVAKPTDLNAGTAVRRLDGEADLKDAFDEIVEPEHNTRGQPRDRVLLLEDLLGGPEVSVEAFTRAGRTRVLGITDKSLTGRPAFVEAAHLFPARLTAAEAAQVEAHVARALAAIGYTHGLSHTEVKLTAAGPRIVEINPRQPGGYIFDLVARVTGSHPLELLVQASLDEPAAIGSPAAPLAGASASSAAIGFVMAERHGTVEAVHGTAALNGDPRVARWTIPTPVAASPPRSNDAYLGHVLTAIPDSGSCNTGSPNTRGSLAEPPRLDARAVVESLVAELRLRFADGQHTAPIALSDDAPQPPG